MMMNQAMSDRTTTREAMASNGVTFSSRVRASTPHRAVACFANGVRGLAGFSLQLGIASSVLTSCGTEGGLGANPGSRPSNTDEPDAGSMLVAPSQSDTSGAPDTLTSALGAGDSVTLTPLFTAPSDMFCVGTVCTTGIPTDLEFNPVRPNELWVVYRQPHPGGLCEDPEAKANADTSGCAYLFGKVAIITDTTTATPQVRVLEDGNSWHFMRLTTSLAFADDDTFATVGEDRTGNPHNQPLDYMGPTLWSSDPAIFALDFKRNGSHLDMLHASPYGMGIAHQKDHVFYVFSGQAGAIDAYDFKAPHEPGGEDHSDGTLLRFAASEVKRSVNVPSHMDFLPNKTTLLIADTGNGRVVALDTTSGTMGGRLSVDDNQIADPRSVDGATLSTLVAPGVMQHPSGLVVGNRSFAVGDATTGRIHQFTFEGVALLTLDTGLPPNALGGLELGPDGYLYLTRKDTNQVVRVDP